MNFKIGDMVTRISHQHDILFKIVEINDNIALLKGVDLRLYADSSVDDLVISKEEEAQEDKKIIEANLRGLNMDRNKYFYLPGKILHIDGDEEYLERCMGFYKSMGVKANGLTLSEVEISSKILDLIKEFRPDIVVITGHDAYYAKKNDIKNIDIVTFMLELIILFKILVILLRQ